MGKGGLQPKHFLLSPSFVEAQLTYNTVQIEDVNVLICYICILQYYNPLQCICMSL